MTHGDGRHKTDVVVVGGGPAGLAAAIAARLQGLRVVVLEAAHPPIDKVCGEGVMPEALAALRRLGVHLTPTHGTPLVGLRFVDGATVCGGPLPLWEWCGYPTSPAPSGPRRACPRGRGGDPLGHSCPGGDAL